MRVEFLKNVDVTDITAIPPEAYGALGIHHVRNKPQFQPDGNVVLVEDTAQDATHYFRGGWRCDLPDEMARQYIAAEQAKEVEPVKRGFVNNEGEIE